MVADVRDDRALCAHGRVVPAEAVARRMSAFVAAVAGECRQVDAADVGDPIVDESDLLVVAMHGSFAGVECHLDERSVHELVALCSNRSARG
jgi:hypothetical protein